MNTMEAKTAVMIAILFGKSFELELHPSLLLHWQYSMKILYVPVRIKQKRSSPTIPGSPMYAQLRKYRHMPLTESPQKVEISFIELNFMLKTTFLTNFTAHCWQNTWQMLQFAHLFAVSNRQCTVVERIGTFWIRVRTTIPTFNAQTCGRTNDKRCYLQLIFLFTLSRLIHKRRITIFSFRSNLKHNQHILWIIVYSGVKDIIFVCRVRSLCI